MGVWLQAAALTLPEQPLPIMKPWMLIWRLWLWRRFPRRIVSAICSATEHVLAYSCSRDYQ